jgi:predicted Zn-dependent protease
MMRQQTYGAGATAALRAIELDGKNADAHFLYAVNLGSEARLKGLSTAAGALSEITLHVRHAIELNPNHAPALQFMGGLLAELPWFLGGDEKEAQQYLERAVTADGNYTHARILLAKLYLKHNRIRDARQQLDAVIHARAPHYPYTWRQKFKPEAEALLEKLGRGD